MSALRQTRPVVEGPRLQLVPTPAPARGFFGTVIVCALLVLSTFGVVFALNTQMVKTAYQVQSVKLQLNEAAAKEATLNSEVISKSTPQNLQAQAEKLGLQAAASTVHLDVATGKIVAPASEENK